MSKRAEMHTQIRLVSSDALAKVLNVTQKGGIMIKKIIFIFMGLALISSVMVGNSNSALLDPNLGGRSSGMGGALVANPDNPLSALFINVAGLTEIEGTNIATGVGYADIRLRYKSPQGYSEQNSSAAVVPYFGYTTDSLRPVVLGLGMYSTLGAGYEFEADPAHGVNGDIKSQAGVLFISPSLAYKITPKLSIGVAFNIGYGMSEMAQPVPLLPPPWPQPYMKIDADGFGYGASIGLLYKHTPSLNFGLSWRSPMRVSQDGEVRIGGEKFDLDLGMCSPQMLNFGIGYHFTPDLLLATSIKWADWSYFDKSKLEFNNFERPFAEDTKDGWRFSLGGEYGVNNVLTLRAGYVYDTCSIKKEWIAPNFWDTISHNLMAGATIKAKKYDIHLFWIYTIFRSRTVYESNTGYPGRYEGDVFPAFGIDFLYHF